MLAGDVDVQSTRLALLPVCSEKSDALLPQALRRWGGAHRWRPALLQMRNELWNVVAFERGRIDRKLSFGGVRVRDGRLCVSACRGTLQVVFLGSFRLSSRLSLCEYVFTGGYMDILQ